MTASGEVTERQTYSVPDAARVLGISREAAYQAVGRGELASIRLGKRILIPRVVIDRLLQGDTDKQTA